MSTQQNGESRRGYDYYANHVFKQAQYAGHVNHHNMGEVIEYADEIADLLLLDEDELRRRVRIMAQRQMIKSF